MNGHNSANCAAKINLVLFCQDVPMLKVFRHNENTIVVWDVTKSVI